MKKITLFLLMAVCVVVLLTTEPCEGKRKTDVTSGEGGEEADGNKPMRRGRHNRERRPGQDDDEQPGEHGNRTSNGYRHRHHGKDRNNNKPRDGDSEPSSGTEE